MLFSSTPPLPTTWNMGMWIRLSLSSFCFSYAERCSVAQSPCSFRGKWWRHSASCSWCAAGQFHWTTSEGLRRFQCILGCFHFLMKATFTNVLPCQIVALYKLFVVWGNHRWWAWSQVKWRRKTEAGHWKLELVKKSCKRRESAKAAAKLCFSGWR